MSSLVGYSIDDNSFVLSSERVIYWEDKKTLIIADLHAGKTGHFRKSGIPVPQNVFKEDLQRLFTQILFFKAEHLIIVGDMSHSQVNKELDHFARWRHDLAALNIQLVKGNHDILQDKWYEDAGITVHHGELIMEHFLFRHEPEKIKSPARKEKFYSFSGHLHPGISISGKGKQSLRFPCYYFTNTYAVLPAFSRFTGTHRIEPKKEDHVFAIVEDQMMQVQ